MEEWQVQSVEYIPADRFWKTIVIKNNNSRVVYFYREVKVGEFVKIRC